MVDIAMCNYTKCLKKDHCLRFTTTNKENIPQAYIYNPKDVCEKSDWKLFLDK